ncbi:MAG TPA: hypothetical protein VMB21_21475 [Candidatus Limnocylindria bacterium]|nr:hypothetical protein [Candidatus Limnocylindria bacterium]
MKNEFMVPKAWLKERLESWDPKELMRMELSRMGLSTDDLKRLESATPSKHWLDKWEALVNARQSDDELWYFESPLETWQSLSGCAGYALVRAGELVNTVVNLKN